MKTLPEISDKKKAELAKAVDYYLQTQGFTLRDPSKLKAHVELAFSYSQRNSGRDLEKTQIEEKKGLKAAFDSDMERLDDALRQLSPTSLRAIENALGYGAQKKYDIPHDLSNRELENVRKVVMESVSNLKKAVVIAREFRSKHKNRGLWKYQFVSYLIGTYQKHILPENPQATFSSSPGAALHTFIEEIGGIIDCEYMDGIPNLRNQIKKRISACN